MRSPWLEIFIGATLVTIGCAVSLLFTIPARAQDVPACTTVAADKAKAEGHHIHWLGIRRMPFSSTEAVFYESGGVVVFSPVRDGCVSPRVFPLYAKYAEESAA